MINSLKLSEKYLLERIKRYKYDKSWTSKILCMASKNKSVIQFKLYKCHIMSRNWDIHKSKAEINLVDSVNQSNNQSLSAEYPENKAY